MQRAASVTFTTGYVEHAKSGESYTAFFEVNAHASRVWRLVCDLAAAILPSEAAPILGVKGDDAPILAPYTLRGIALAVLEPYVDYLQHDGFLEFGLIHQRQGRTEEVFVKSAKYLQVWTNHPNRVRAVLASSGVPQMPDLAFIDEYPLVRETLPRPDGQAGWAWVVDELRYAFAGMPAPPPKQGV
jgi:hypothetical protein